MIQSLHAIVSIFLVLVLGYLIGKVLRPSIRLLLVAKISPIVLLLLFLMGLELGSIFTDSALGISVITRAFFLALTIAVVTAFLLFSRETAQSTSTGQPNVLHAFYGCLKAILAFGFGVLLFAATGYQRGNFFISSTFVLYLIVFLVGIDFVGFSWGKLTADLIKLPLLTIVATVIATGVYALFSDLTWPETLLSASGFGWFSLSRGRW